MINKIPWTQQQLEFYSRLESTEDSIMLSSVAGSGKTTSLAEGASRLRGTTLAVAFNVKIKKTLEERIGHIATCKTLNGLGHGALVKFFGHRVSIDRDKVHKLLSDLFSKKENKEFWDLFGATKQLVARAKHHGLIPSNTPGMYKSITPDTPEAWEELALHYDIQFNTLIHELARRTLVESIRLSWAGTCDFDDQVYLPACFSMSFEKFDNVIVDEAQDLSEIQHRILKKVLRKGGRVIAVGDENQAIYGWRGAMSNSINKLTETFDLKRMELTVSFRCAQSIVLEAKKIVPRIEFSNTAPVGDVITRGEYDHDLFKTGDVVLCRNNAPLIKTAYRLIANGQGVYVMGRDIGYGLKVLIRNLVGKKKGATLDTLMDELWEWNDTEIARAVKKGQFSKAETISDKAESLDAVIRYSNAKTIQEVIDGIDKLFGKESAPITLSTVHRAKGLEWPRVYILNEYLMPSKWSVKAFEKDPKRYAWMMQEEDNIRYVAVTRAQVELNYISSEGWKKDS